MVATYNLHRSTIKIFCLLRKEWTLADRNNPLVLPFLFRAVNTIVEGSTQSWKKQQPSNQKRSVNHLAFIFSPYSFPIFLSFWKQNISDKFIFIGVISRNDGSIELSWEIMHWVSVQTNSALYWCKLIWGSLNTLQLESEYFRPWPSCPLLLVQSFEQIVEWLLFMANTEKQLSFGMCSGSL